MFNSFPQRFDVAKHHGCRAEASHLVPYAHDVKPVVSHDFATRYFTAYSVNQDFSSTAGNTTQTSFFEPFQDYTNGEFIDLRKMMEFWWAEPMDVDLRELATDIVQQLFIPVQSIFLMQATLHQDLVTSQVDRLLNLVE